MWIVKAFKWFGRHIGIFNENNGRNSKSFSSSTKEEPYELVQLRSARDDALKAYQGASKLQKEACHRYMELTKNFVDMYGLIGRNAQNFIACVTADRELDRQYQELLDLNPEENNAEEHQEAFERIRRLREQLEALRRSESVRLEQMKEACKFEEQREAYNVWEELEKDEELKRSEYMDCENRLAAFKSSHG